jgi:TIR domain
MSDHAVKHGSAAKELAQMVIRALARGLPVEVDGLGIFYPDASHGCRFQPSLPQVFLAYVEEDRDTAEWLYRALQAEGFAPWMDVCKLLPGQNWPRSIEAAIETSDFFVACFSSRSATKRGGFQAEIRYALDCARRIPLDDIFVVPVRLDHCRVPRAVQKELQYIDLFPDRERGLRRLTAALRRRNRF